MLDNQLTILLTKAMTDVQAPLSTVLPRSH